MANNQAEYYRGVEAAGSAVAALPTVAAQARATAVHAISDDLLRDTSAVAERACRVGCSHCCHFPVGVTFGEALAVAEVVRASSALTASLHRERAASAALPWAQLVGRACPFLVQGHCAVYAVRPLPCRALASRDANACAAVLHGAKGIEVPRDDEAYWRGLGAAAILAADHPAGSRELRSAVAALLAESSAAAFATAQPTD